MARKTFSDIFLEVSAAPDDEMKVMLLQSNNTPGLRQLLMAALNSDIKFDVAIPSYRENMETDGYSANSLYVEVKRLYIFMDTYDKITAKRKEVLLAQILESIDASDAVLLTKIIQRDISEYGINKEIVNQAFPGLIK